MPAYSSNGQTAQREIDPSLNLHLTGYGLQHLLIRLASPQQGRQEQDAPEEKSAREHQK